MTRGVNKVKSNQITAGYLQFPRKSLVAYHDRFNHMEAGRHRLAGISAS